MKRLIGVFIVVYVFLVTADTAVTAPSIYGIFVGLHYGHFHRGDEDATNMYNAFANNVPNFVKGVVITADVSAGEGCTEYVIMYAINQLSLWDVQDDDILVLHFSSHGGYYPDGSETTDTPGDEYIDLGYSVGGSLLTDMFLTAILHDLPRLQKWVLLDTCHSGGFWGDYNPADWGDLEILSKIGLFAACAEDDVCYSNLAGHGLFTNELVHALSLTPDGYLRADNDPADGVLTWDELTNQVRNNPSWLPPFETEVYEKGMGDLFLFSPHMYSPVSYSSDDFIGSIIYTSTLSATVNIDPDTLNLQNEGKWITCYIQPPETHDVGDIDVDSILLEGLLDVKHYDIEGNVLSAKFDRQDVIAYIELVLGITPPDYVALTVTGDLTEMLSFKGADEIRVIGENN